MVAYLKVKQEALLCYCLDAVRFNLYSTARVVFLCTMLTFVGVLPVPEVTRSQCEESSRDEAASKAEVRARENAHFRRQSSTTS